MKAKTSTLSKLTSLQNAEAQSPTETQSHTAFDVSTTTSPEPYVYSQISISEYRILNPQTAEIPTLTQSRLLAAVLERQRIKAERLARRQALKRKLLNELRNTFAHPWQALTALLHASPSHRPTATLTFSGRA